MDLILSHYKILPYGLVQSKSTFISRENFPIKNNFLRPSVIRNQHNFFFRDDCYITYYQLMRMRRVYASHETFKTTFRIGKYFKAVMSQVVCGSYQPKQGSRKIVIVAIKICMHDAVACLGLMHLVMRHLCFDEIQQYSKIKYYHRKPKYLILEWFYKEPEIKNMTSVKTNIYVLVSSCFLRI